MRSNLKPAHQRSLPFMGLGQWIAIVDDDASVRTSLARLLRSEGILVETFGSGPEFLTANAIEPPACLILDVHLGTMSGFEIQEEMALTHPHVPIIFITAHDEIASTELTRRAGANGFLRKPFDGEAFLAMVRRRLRAVATRNRNTRRSVPGAAG
jgi:FixJ family two-component response regulator